MLNCLEYCFYWKTPVLAVRCYYRLLTVLQRSNNENKLQLVMIDKCNHTVLGTWTVDDKWPVSGSRIFSLEYLLILTILVFNIPSYLQHSYSHQTNLVRPRNVGN